MNIPSGLLNRVNECGLKNGVEPRRNLLTAKARLIRVSVAGQEEYDNKTTEFQSTAFVRGLISSIMPQSSIVLPLPASPLIHSNGASSCLIHRLKVSVLFPFAS
jgi:hypothetical protein